MTKDGIVFEIGIAIIPIHSPAYQSINFSSHNFYTNLNFWTNRNQTLYRGSFKGCGLDNETKSFKGSLLKGTH